MPTTTLDPLGPDLRADDATASNTTRPAFSMTCGKTLGDFLKTQSIKVTLFSLVMLAAGCGGGGNNSSDQGAGPPMTTRVAAVSIDPTIDAAVRSSIKSVLSPAAVGSLDSGIRVPVSTTTGQTLTLATDAAGHIRLASIDAAGTALVTLTAESTGLALARVANRATATPEQALELDRSIRAAPAFPSLVSAIGSAVMSGAAPLTSPAVITSLAEVVDAVAPSKAAPTWKLERAQRNVTTPTVSPNALPHLVIKNSIGALYDGVSVSSVSPSSVTIVNDMVIPWAVTVEAGDGKVSTDSVVIGPEETNSFSAAGAVSGFNVFVEQNSESRDRIGRLVAKALADIALSFVPNNSCKLAMETAVASLALNGVASIWDALGALKANGRIAEQCGTGMAELLGALIFGVLDQYKKVEIAWKGLSLVALAKTADLHWNDGGGAGFCIDSVQGKTIVCPSSVEFERPTVTAAPGATLEIPRLLVGPTGVKTTPAPDALVFRSGNPEVATVEPQTGKITAVKESPSPVAIIAEESWSGAVGQMQVLVSTPRIVPNEAQLVRGGGNQVTLKITGPNGEPIVLPERAITWKVILGPGITMVSSGSTDEGFYSRWEAPAATGTGLARVGAYTVSGEPIAQATVEVIDDCFVPAGSTDIRLPSVCYRKSARLEPGKPRPLTDFVVIDPGNDPRVTSITVIMGFWKDTPSALRIQGAPSGPEGQSHYYGREVHPIHSHIQGEDIYYSCQNLPPPHPDIFSSLSLVVDQSFTGTSIDLPVFVVQYQRKLQAQSCENGGYLPFQRINVMDCPSATTGECNPFVVGVTRPG